jgi:hypothetical protein
MAELDARNLPVRTGMLIDAIVIRAASRKDGMRAGMPMRAAGR